MESATGNLSWLQTHFYDLKLLSDKGDKKVWRAYSTNYKQYVAVKYIKTKTLADFNLYSKQILTINSIFHNSVCKVLNYHFNHVPNEYYEVYYSMEFADKILENDIKAGFRFQKEDVLVILRNLVDALQLLQVRYMLPHKNLTPANIVKIDDRYKIKEFSMKLRIDSSQEKENQYLAPEYFDEAYEYGTIDHSGGDVFALGMLGMDLCGIDTSRMQFWNMSSSETSALEYQTAQQNIVDDYGEDLALFLQKLLIRDPHRRTTFNLAKPELDELLKENLVDIKTYEYKKKDPFVHLVSYVGSLRKSMQEQYGQVQAQYEEMTRSMASTANENTAELDSETYEQTERYRVDPNETVDYTDEVKFNLTSRDENNMGDFQMSDSSFIFRADDEDEIEAQRNRDNQNYTPEDFIRNVSNTGSWKTGLAIFTLMSVLELLILVYIYLKTINHKTYFQFHLAAVFALFICALLYDTITKKWIAIRALLLPDYCLYITRSGEVRHRFSLVATLARLILVTSSIYVYRMSESPEDSSKNWIKVLLWVLAFKEILRNLFIHFVYRFDHYYHAEQRVQNTEMASVNRSAGL